MAKILFIDDIRNPFKYFNDKDNVIISVCNYQEAINALKTFTFDVISFDHDLGEEKTGYDIAKYIVENQLPLNQFHIHSANPVGVTNIRQLLTHYGYKELY